MQRRKPGKMVQDEINPGTSRMRAQGSIGDFLRHLTAALVVLSMVLAMPGLARAQDLGTVFFDFGSAVLDAEARAEVEAIARSIKDSPSYRPTVVVGHTDAVGSAEYNMRLGQRRAQAVAEALTAQGVPVSRIGTVSSRGKTELVVAVATAERRNRRVEVSLDEMLAACRSFRQIDLNPAGFGEAFESDLRSRLVEASGAFERFAADGRNGPAFQMAGAAKHDCGIATSLGASEPRKLEYGQRCFCNSARLRVALGQG